MSTDLLFIHSAGNQADGEGSSKLLAWVKAELDGKYNIVAPAMPHPESPNYGDWEVELASLFATLGENAVVVGHSLGGSSLLKYLTENKVAQDIAGLFVIAAPYWGADANWDEEIFKFQSDEPSEIDKVKNIFIYHSKDDEVVPFGHLDRYAQKFPLAIAVSVEGAGHSFAEKVESIMQDIQP